MQALGLSFLRSWLSTIGFAIAGLAVVLACSPLADRVAARLVHKPPSLAAFRMLQESRSKLFVGIVLAWVFGGFLEELLLRGIIVQRVERLMSPWLVKPMATAIAVSTAAAGAGLIHLYQGLRAAIIITQLSLLFGALFVASGYNLWAVILCHGLYDTIAFLRFGRRRSKYSNV
jgi:membrane protease YdiL (CAAX protease family)